jgi:hypothetical protein
MNDGTVSRLSLGLVATIVACPTLVVVILFVALWNYHELLGWCIVLLAVLTVLVLLGLFVTNQLNEMAIRRQRYRHQEETPLGFGGAWPQLRHPPDGQTYARSYQQEVYE